MSVSFSSRDFMVSFFTFRSLIHFELIFVSGARENFCIIILHMGIQFSQILCGRVCSFPSVNSWHLLQKLVGPIYLDLLLVCLFCFIGVCVCFYVNTILSVIMVLQYILKSDIVMPPDLFYLFGTALAVQGLRYFHLNFSIIFF
jgi:hypothetical protein